MTSTQQELYDTFLTSTPYCWCWRCGRGLEHQPADWWGPWLVERAHMASIPRVEDRRCVILLCSLCHRLQHGHQIELDYEPELERELTLELMLGLKCRFDLEYWEPGFVSKHLIGRMPEPVWDPGNDRVYASRRGCYA